MVPVFLFPSTWDEWRGWMGHQLLEVLAILASVIVVNLLFRRVFTRFLYRAIVRGSQRRREDPQVAERRAGTLVATLNWLFAIFVTFIGVSLALDNLGMNVSALVASVGVAGLALGLGTQTLIKDVINGTFILLEDQYGVGDIVTVAGVSGQVIEINPRRTVLRDLDGKVHSIPNSSITVATNMTQGFSRINLDVPVPLRMTPERATRIVNEASASLAAERPREFLDQPRVLRIDDLTEDAVVLKVVGDVKAGRQWDLTGELRYRIRHRLDEAAADESRAEPGRAASQARVTPEQNGPEVTRQDAPKDSPFDG